MRHHLKTLFLTAALLGSASCSDETQPTPSTDADDSQADEDVMDDGDDSDDADGSDDAEGSDEEAQPAGSKDAGGGSKDAGGANGGGAKDGGTPKDAGGTSMDGGAGPSGDAASGAKSDGASPSAAHEATDGAVSDSGTTQAPSGDNCLQGSGDFTDRGPYDVTQKDVTIGSKGAFTIFYPKTLESACPHPIVAWGNGTLITGSSPYDHFHEHAASWGIVSVVSHSSSVGDGSFHKAGIDYLLAQNEESGSEFSGKLSPRAGVSGHSQGGAGADRSAPHPNVEAVVNVQGSFGTPPESDAAFLCLTGTEDIQPTGCPMAVRAAKVPALSANYDGADHVSTTIGGTDDGAKQYIRLYSAWFRCFLADDQQACALFKGGADCPVCKEPGWEEIFTANY